MTHLRWFVHNVIAHPLLVFCPPVGWRLHDLTAPEDIEPDERAEGSGSDGNV